MAKIKGRSTDSRRTKPKNVNSKAFERVYWPYIPLVLAISLLLTIGGRSGGLAHAVHKPFGSVLSYSTTMSIGGLLADTNAQRAANGVGNLSLNSQLDAAAQAKADDMAARNYWSHYTPEGNPPWVFVSNQGYAYKALGENLAAGFSDEQATLNGWMASPPHRENLLNSGFSEVGFGYANNPDYTSAGGGPMTVVVAFYGSPQVLGAATVSPPPAPPAAAAASVPPAAPPAAPEPTPAAPEVSAAADSPAAKQAASTSTPKSKLAPAVTTSRLQLASPSMSYGWLATKIGIILAIGLALFWAGRHMRALKKYLLEGEIYAIRHPLTDIGLILVACLLFILSQTAGLIQ